MNLSCRGKMITKFKSILKINIRPNIKLTEKNPINYNKINSTQKGKKQRITSYVLYNVEKKSLFFSELDIASLFQNFFYL